MLDFLPLLETHAPENEIVEKIMNLFHRYLTAFSPLAKEHKMLVGTPRNAPGLCSPGPRRPSWLVGCRTSSVLYTHSPAGRSGGGENVKSVQR